MHNLCQPDILMKLVTLVTSDPPDDADERNRYKYANMAYEVLSSEKSQICETFANHPDLVSNLYEKLQSAEPLNPLLASLICKVIFSLLQNVSKVSDDIHSRRGDFVSSLVANVGTSAVMDLLFKSISCSASPEISSAYLNFYYKQGLVEKLIALFKADVDPAAQSNAAQLLCDILVIRCSREHQTCNLENAGPNSLLDDIESTDTITNLLTNMFETRTESCLVNGIQVIQALLEYRRYRTNLPFISHVCCQRNSVTRFDDTDIERLTKSVQQVHAAIVPRLEDFHSLLTNPPEKSSVVHLIRTLLSSNNPTINRKLTTLKTLPVLMDLFFAYPYNNFLHTQVEQSINCILDNPKSTSPVTSPTEIEEKGMVKTEKLILSSSTDTQDNSYTR
uniref:Uncharacterized protein n=1 Tax=Tetranychus urticae TaxID=32264 RepID=T1L1S5_TETUR